MELPYDPAILLPCIYAKKPKTLIQKNTCTPMFIAVLFISQDMESTYVHINKQVDKEVVVHICYGEPKQIYLQKFLYLYLHVYTSVTFKVLFI